MQLRFASFAVINLRRDLHPQECARAGRTKKKGLACEAFFVSEAVYFLRAAIAFSAVLTRSAPIRVFHFA
jgi:hypothetical protein